MIAASTSTLRRPPVRLTGVHALAVLVAGGALTWLVTHVTQRAWEPEPEIPISVAGEHYRVAPEELRGLQTFSSLHFSEAQIGARGVVAAEIAAHLDRMFDGAHARVPEFVDWYYSLRGEYSRAAMAALEYAKVAEPGYVAGRAASLLLPDDVWSENLAALEQRAAERLLTHSAQVRDDWLGGVSRRLAGHRVPAPLAMDDARAADDIRLDPLLERLRSLERGALDTRLSISTIAAGGAAAGPTLWRAVAARTSASASRAATARAAGRAAARAGAAAARVGPAAAGSAALCAAGGPAAIGCAIVAGAAAWLGTDWALLRLDEQLHRDDLERALDAALVALREQIEQDLNAVYEESIAAQYGAARESIRRSFVPARAGAVQTSP